ncbi:regulatory inactivation of DnaA Hda protein [Andreprevotia lacus DSM 23236]|jgi:DnaA family protein|uniref:Regulatory inactivation of DnaA Hda protein n=1 Tax=Andreprevotia lacus DSM 23236 TaxID=1121001 RepID=A0A1W1XTS9_9NEIS|nr:DnaA regulatory inactivator Hda [Andreprevotia lacus]SMC26908.1 regulatory inactivation of DnaA Hda protein [Andreprevotia lacus DSM 23236]
MKQLVLDLRLATPPGFDDFVRGDNAELLFMLSEWAARSEHTRFIYLWGESGAGKSHLLQAAAGRLGDAVHVDAATTALPWPLAADASLIVDNVGALDAEQQIRLFDHYNTLREGSGRLLAAGPLPPMLLQQQLQLRDDLTTRLGWGLVYQLKALSEPDRIAALKRHARKLGFELGDDAADYLLRHAARDLGSLSALLELANERALSLKRQVTIALVREVLHPPAA